MSRSRNPHIRRPRESENPALSLSLGESREVPAFAGTTVSATIAVPRGQSGRAAFWMIIALLLIAILAASGWFYLDYRRFVDAPLTVTQPDATIDIARGETYRSIVEQLRRERATDASPWYWRALGRELGTGGKLHAGEYALTVGLTPRALLQKMAAGEVVQHHFTIVDGWTFRQLRLALAADAGLAQTLPGMSDADIAQKLGIVETNPEGWFLPETYSWIKGDSDFSVLKNAHAAMRKALDKAWTTRAPDLPLASPYEALILASIVEKETARVDERPLIAGVFVRRLKARMRLQTDPTVIYGMGAAYAGNIRRADLDTDTPYNTYTRDGLPPTPIALAGTPALDAALHPAPGDALYFVARGDGSHEFSATLDAHNRAVQKFQLHRP